MFFLHLNLKIIRCNMTFWSWFETDTQSMCRSYNMYVSAETSPNSTTKRPNSRHVLQRSGYFELCFHVLKTKLMLVQTNALLKHLTFVKLITKSSRCYKIFWIFSIQCILLVVNEHCNDGTLICYIWNLYIYMCYVIIR